MDKGYEQKYHSIEEYNWWFVARRQTILTMLKDAPRNARILDIGCSGGVLMLALQDAGFTNVSGLDFSVDAVEQCKSKGLKNVYEMDAHHPNFPDDSFDIIIASDCLEHLEKDELALKNWHKLLKKGGKGYIFVPAFMSLWTPHDEINHHYRRYTKQELTKKATSAGFQITKSSYWNFSLFFPTWVIRSLKKKKLKNAEQPKDDMENVNPVVNKVLKTLIRLEDIFFNSMGFPVGVSTMVSVTK